MPTSLIDLPIATIEKVLEIRKKIEALKESVAEILDGGEVSKPAAAASVAVVKDGRKGKRSPAARAKMAAAQKARWAKKKGISAKVTPVAAPVSSGKKRRTMSPEGRARIAAAQRARWAKQKTS
jgi:hypothetical protein